MSLGYIGYAKLADLRDNMDLYGIDNPTKKDYERIEKYREAEKRIVEFLKADGDEELI